MGIKKGTIWFAANIEPNSFGGISRVMHSYTEILSDRGYNCKIIVNRPGNQTGYVKFACKILLMLIANLYSAPDWIIARSSDGVFCAAFLRIFGKVLGIKTRIAVHNHGWEEKLFEIEKRLPSRLIFPRTTIMAHLIRFPLLRTSLYAGDCCLCGTLSEIKWLKNRYPRVNKKLFFLPNGVHMPTNNMISRFNKQPEELGFVSVGGATWKKNLSHTVNVFENVLRSCANCSLTMVGAQRSSFENSYSNILQHISFKSQATFDCMEQIFAKKHILISSSRFEGGHSLAVLEAMSHGMIVFVSSIDSMREIVKDGINGFLLTGVDVNADAHKIVSVIQDHAKMKKISKGAFTSASRHSWMRQSNRLEKILKNV